MTTQPKPFAFVLMPFKQDFDDTYKVAVKPACEAAGAYAERVDEQTYNSSIVERIHNQISKADLIVAILTGKNPNVFYEVGYAHALGKTTILATNSVDDIPFDLAHLPHIVYADSLADLKEKLEGIVRWHVQNPSRSDESITDIAARVNGVRLDDTKVVPMQTSNNLRQLGLRVELENRAGRLIRTVEGRMGLIIPRNCAPINRQFEAVNFVVDIDDSTYLCLTPPFKLLPGEWWRTDIAIALRDRLTFQTNERVPLAIRLLLPSGVRDYQFEVEVRTASE